jgi:hypothetical protein
MQNRLRKKEDEAWAKMVILLDKEMPQKEKKRRIILWYFAAAVAIPLIAIGSWSAMSSSNHALSSDVNMQSIAVNQSNVDDSPAIASKVPQNAIIADNTTSPSVSNLSNLSSVPHIRSANALHKDQAIVHTQMSNDENEGIDENNSFSQNSQIQNQAIINTIASIDPQENVDNVEPNKLRNLGTLQAISSKKYMALESDATRNMDITLEPHNQTFKRPSDPKRLAIAIGAGTRMMLPINKPMALVGLNFGYNINEKWIIGTGLYYSVATQSSDSLEVAANYYGEYAAQLDKSTIQGFNSAEYSYIKDIILFDHKIIHIPFVVGYSFNKHLSLSGGVYYDKMVSQRTNYILLDVKSGAGSTTNDGRNVFTNRIYSHNLNWMASIGYDISRKFNISFDLMGNNKFISGNKSGNNAAPILQLKANYNLASLF